MMNTKVPRINNNFQLHRVKVLNNIELSSGVYLISWKRTIAFTAGQVVKLSIDQQQPPRIYSICSGEDDEKMSVLFNVKDEGLLTPKLAAAIPGDVLWVSNPYGNFSDDDSPAYWIATGTGVAPFYSMFRSGLSGKKILVHGVRFLHQFYFEDELEWALDKNYIRCCSREQSCIAVPGHVTDYLIEKNDFPKDYKYYLCGKSLMVVEVRDLLISKGIPLDKIFAEIYF